MNPPDPYLEKLLDAWFHGGLDATRKRDLEELLTTSAAARQQFQSRAAMESALERWAENSRGGLIAFQPTSPVPAPARKFRRVGLGLGLAAGAAAALLGLGSFFQWRQDTEPSGKTVASANPDTALAPAPAPAPAMLPPDMTAEAPVAYLSRLSGVPSEDGLMEGQCLSAGREFSIRQGELELDFYSGARVAIKGPARFVPGSDMRLTVLEGSVQVEVPESAKGFVMVLPDGQVTDFGTRFEVVVKDRKTSRLQVTQGVVELAPTSATSPARRLVEGDALSLAHPDGPRPIDFLPMARDSIIASSTRDSQLRAARWEETCADLAKDPSLLVHFRFLQEEKDSREIINRSRAVNMPRHGTVIAASWTRGRWEGKAALSFSGPSDRVRVDLPGEYPQATFAAWVKVDGFPRRYNGLFLSEGDVPGEAHWQFSTEGGFMFGVRPREFRQDSSFHRHWSEPVLFARDFGTWRLLATTYNSIERTVAHYVDGREVYRKATDHDIPLHFGRATLGNFHDPNPTAHANQPGLGESWSFRNWCGAIDEFLLFSRALSAAEIAALHEAGRAG